MTEQLDGIPPRLKEIIDEFHESDRQEKLDLLLEFSDKLPALPEWLRDRRDSMDQVHECMTPVFLHAELQGGGMAFFFDVPEEAPTVRGFAAILDQGLSGLPPAAVLQVPVDFYRRMEIEHILSPRRLNGMTALLAHMKRLTVQVAGASRLGPVA